MTQLQFVCLWKSSFNPSVWFRVSCNQWWA